MEDELDYSVNNLSSKMIKIFKKRDEYKDKGRTLGLGGGPDADWRVMFSIFVTLLIIVFIYSGMTFINVMRGGFGSQMIDTAESPVDKDLLKKNTSYYKEKKSAFDTLKTEKELTPDPSR